MKGFAVEMTVLDGMATVVDPLLRCWRVGDGSEVAIEHLRLGRGSNAEVQPYRYGLGMPSTPTYTKKLRLITVRLNKQVHLR